MLVLLQFRVEFSFTSPVFRDIQPRLCLLNRAAVGWAVSCSAFGIFSLVGEQTQTPTRPLLSPDDVIISQLQAISQLFSSYPPSLPQEHFVKLAN